MSNIIDFRSAFALRASCMPTEKVRPFEPRVTKRQLAGRKRNPLRHLYSRMEVAVTIAGKLHRGEAIRSDRFFDDSEWLRRGAEAARRLADELARLADQHSGRAPQRAT